MRKFRASLLGCCLLFCSAAHAGFRDDFDRPLVHDSAAAEGWTWRTGDGRAKVEFSASDGVGRVAVDATSDRRNIWWAIIRRQVSPAVDVARLAQPGTELRVEARVRTSHAPRRINLHFNTPRTTDFHGNLLEFDLPTAGEWHTVSMTTRDFDARPEDRVFVQLALMDWGLGRYQVDVDYLQVDVVDAATAPPDVGDGQPYHPPPPAPESLRHAIDALHSATVDRLEPDANLHDWSAIGRDGPQRILGISGTQIALLRWDLAALAGAKVEGTGLLELTTHSVHRAATPRKDFGLVRVVEILAGDPAWAPATVTYDSLHAGRAADEVFNTQMLVDVELNDTAGGRTGVPISRAVLQRLVDGRTLGLALMPLGSINAALYPAEPASDRSPKLRLNVADPVP